MTPRRDQCRHQHFEDVFVRPEGGGLGEWVSMLVRCPNKMDPGRWAVGGTRCREHQYEERGCAEHDKLNCKRCKGGRLVF